MQAEGWVVAGGRSVRMGRDKALAEVAGMRMLDRMLDKIHTLGLEAKIAGLQIPQCAGTTQVFPDALPGCGPLGGIATALRYCRTRRVLLLSVDLPLVSVAFLSSMLARAQITGALATIPRIGGIPQPLCAVYCCDLSGAVQTELDRGERKVMTAIERSTERQPGALDCFAVESLATARGWNTQAPVTFEFMNCNTPPELALAERLIKGNLK